MFRAAIVVLATTTVLVGSSSANATPALVALTRTFSPNAVTISTSEGAPYGDCNFWVQGAASCSTESNFGYGPTKVVRLYICLTGEVSLDQCAQQPVATGALSGAMLSDMDTRIAAFAGTGIRVMVRFIYNFGPLGATDASIGVISQHIDQVAPILLHNRDLVFALEAGFIGTWGEWHHSTNGNDTPSAHKIVLDKELAYFKDVFPILVRYPGDLATYAGNMTPSASLGLHDDYYASNADDGGTWSFPNYGFPASQLKAYANQVSTTSMFAGEFGELNTDLQACAPLDAYSFTYHVQSISLFPYPPEIGTFLQNQGCATSFFSRVGTRITLQRATINGALTSGGILHAQVTLVNEGYGRVIRQRPVTVVVSQQGLVVAQTPIALADLDLRTLAASAAPVPRTFTFDFNLPQQLRPGAMSISLLIRDPAPSLASQAAYALPLNSLDEQGRPIFDPATGYNLLATLTVSPSVPSDFDGDGETDIGVYRPSSGGWYLLKSSTNFTVGLGYAWGANGDVPVPGDYDGDGRTDIAVYRPSQAYWFILKSTTNYTAWDTYQWGTTGDVPVAADYDGDGRTDIAIYRPSTGAWYILTSSSGFRAGAGYTWGAAGDTPVPYDFDGDGRADIAVYRASQAYWFILKSTTNYTAWDTYQWGTTGDVPVAADYDGDGRTDIAIHRPSNGSWYFLKSSTNYTAGAGYAWGTNGDVPVPGDYDGDGKADIAVYRPSSGHFFILKSTTAYTANSTYQWGTAGDVPILRRP